MEQQTGSRLEKELHQGCILSPSLFNLYQSISCEMPGWLKHKLESKLPGEISKTSDTQMTQPLYQKVKKDFHQELLDESERGEQKR